MADREKVIYSIERCICHVPDACRDCAYDAGHPYNECVEMLLRDALELMKAQETMVMTLEEVKNAEIVWIEQGGQCVPAIKIRTLEDGKMIFAYSYDDNIHTINIMPKYYGEISRCWTFKPTDEQREAVKWDD
jgi:hypothetical protein